MSIFQSIIFGIVQGLTEFIPVSSTAHLLIAQTLFGITNQAFPQMFEYLVLIQLGTLLALIVFFWKDLYEIVRCVLVGLFERRPFADTKARRGWFLVLATIPAAVAGLALRHVVEALFQASALEASIRLWLTVVLLVVAEYFGKKTRRFESFTWLDALWVGVAQILSVIPGTSRSGSTIAGGMTRNFDRPSAARFAFLLSVPTMLGAGLVEGRDLLKDPHLMAVLPQFIVGFIVAAIIGYLAIRWLMSYLNRHSLYVFAGYCAVAGVVALFLAR